MQVSPVPDAALASPFAYAGDNPLTGMDPSGHWCLLGCVTHWVAHTFDTARHSGSHGFDVFRHAVARVLRPVVNAGHAVIDAGRRGAGAARTYIEKTPLCKAATSGGAR